MGSNSLTPMGDCSVAEGQHPVESAGLNLTPFAGSAGYFCTTGDLWRFGRSKFWERSWLE